MNLCEAWGDCACCHPSFMMNCRCIWNSAVFLISLVLLAAKFSSRFCERMDLLAWSVSTLAEKISAVGFLCPDKLLSYFGKILQRHGLWCDVYARGEHYNPLDHCKVQRCICGGGCGWFIMLNPVPPSLTALSPVLGSWRAMSSLTVKYKTHFSLFNELDTLWLLLI